MNRLQGRVVYKTCTHTSLLIPNKNHSLKTETTPTALRMLIYKLQACQTVNKFTIKPLTHLGHIIKDPVSYVSHQLV